MPHGKWKHDVLPVTERLKMYRSSSKTCESHPKWIGRFSFIPNSPKPNKNRNGDLLLVLLLCLCKYFQRTLSASQTATQAESECKGRHWTGNNQTIKQKNTDEKRIFRFNGQIKDTKTELTLLYICARKSGDQGEHHPQWSPKHSNRLLASPPYLTTNTILYGKLLRLVFPVSAL